jgi:SAM-dependent methyltransferase
MTLDATRASYDENRQREWNRLETRAQGRLEFLITMYALQGHLPPPGARVLDAGGGPGRYTIALAALGYRMTLLDLSPGLIEEARERIAAEPAMVQSHIEETVTGSIIDLSRFADNAFDAALCLGGPLSHVIDADERARAVAELRRVTRRGGTIAISVMGRIGFLRSAVQWLNWFDGGVPEVRFSSTVRVSSPPMLAYPFMPGELEELMGSGGIDVIRSYGCQGIGAHLQEENLLEIMDDPTRWALWEPELLATCDEPSVIGVSSHLLAVGRKR